MLGRVAELIAKAQNALRSNVNYIAAVGAWQNVDLNANYGLFATLPDHPQYVKVLLPENLRVRLRPLLLLPPKRSFVLEALFCAGGFRTPVAEKLEAFLRDIEVGDFRCNRNPNPNPNPNPNLTQP